MFKFPGRDREGERGGAEELGRANGHQSAHRDRLHRRQEGG